MYVGKDEQREFSEFTFKMAIKSHLTVSGLLIPSLSHPLRAVKSRGGIGTLVHPLLFSKRRKRLEIARRFFVWEI